MVLTRSQYENMSREEFIQELPDINSTSVNGINTKLSNIKKSLMISCQNMIKLIRSCNSVKKLTHAY